MIDLETLFNSGFLDWTITSLNERRWFPFKNGSIEKIVVEKLSPEKVGFGEVSIAILRLRVAGRDEVISIPVHFEKSMRSGFLASVSLRGEEIYMHDATESGAILNLMRSVASGKPGDLTFNGRRVNEMKNILSGNPSFRLLSVDQSNTSFILGEKVICKYFRRPTVPPSADFEISSMIEETGGSGIVPAPYCEMTTSFSNSENFSILMVQEFIRDSTDYFKLMDKNRKDLLNPGPSGDQNTLFRIRKDMAGVAVLTARMHRAMARFSRSGYDPEPYTKEDAARYDEELKLHMESALQTMENSRILNTQRKEKLVFIMNGLRRSNPFTAGYQDGLKKQKIHGDFHLGQVITSPAGPLAIDFEGEPMATYASRMKKKLPAQDVAGIIRSIYYAFSSSYLKAGESEKAILDHLKNTSRSLFLRIYYAEAASQEITGKSIDDFSKTVRLFETLKVFYELNYELNNRPAMVEIPADDIIDLFSGE